MTISPIWRRAPAKRTITKFGMRGRVADVIICFKCYRNRLRGFRAMRGQKWGSTIDFDRRPYNRSAQVSTTVLPVIDYTISLYIAFVHSHISSAADLYLNTYESSFDKLTKVVNEWILQNKDMYFPKFQLYKYFSTLPTKLHEQQILYTFTWFLLSLYNDYFKYDSTLCSSQFSLIVYQSAILPLSVSS